MNPDRFAGRDIVIKEGVRIGEDVEIGEHCFLDYNVIIRDHVSIGAGSYIGANCILGEYLSDFFPGYTAGKHPLKIGERAVIRSGSILYGDTVIGDCFSTGHRVTVREGTVMGSHVSLGTLSDIQGNCRIGNYVRMHSNVHVGMKTQIGDFVWVFPYVVFTNDPTPPSENLAGSVVESFAVICTGTTVLPGIHIGKDALVGAGTVLTKDVPEQAVFLGNPGRAAGRVTEIKDREGKNVYPWRYTFKRSMPWEDSDFDSWNEGRRALISGGGYEHIHLRGKTTVLSTASKLKDKVWGERKGSGYKCACYRLNINGEEGAYAAA